MIPGGPERKEADSVPTSLPPPLPLLSPPEASRDREEVQVGRFRPEGSEEERPAEQTQRCTKPNGDQTGANLCIWSIYLHQNQGSGSRQQSSGIESGLNR